MGKDKHGVTFYLVLMASAFVAGLVGVFALATHAKGDELCPGEGCGDREAPRYMRTVDAPAVKAKFKGLIEQTNFLVNRGCSGTLIDTLNGYVLSAYHCVDTQYRTVEREKVDAEGVVKKEKIKVTEPGTVTQITYKNSYEVSRVSYIVKVVARDERTDLSLLKIQGKLDAGRMSAKLACTDPDLGDRVRAVGNSYAILYSTLTEGIVSSLNRSYRDLTLQGELGDATDDGEHGLVQHSAIIAGGNSGGALYNDKWELVGVNVRGGASGFSFSVPLSDIKKFLSTNGAEHLTLCE
jgi:S1-C subfamily serine protease